MSEQRDNSAIAFKNDKRREGKNDPQFRGQGIVNGQEVWVSCWVKEGQKGKYLTFAFSKKEATNAKPKQDAFSHSEERDEIPF